VDYTRLGKLGKLQNITCTVQGQPTNTRGTESYDNIVFNKAATTEFAQQAGIVDLKKEFRISLEQALKVSDHLPIWADFKATEGSSPVLVADRPRPSSGTVPAKTSAGSTTQRSR
jgi:hypothetical protein